MINKYKKDICEKLIAKYESRYNSGSDFQRKITLKFDEKGYKIYTLDNAYEYRYAIDEACLQLEKSGLISVSYFKATKDISQIQLCIDKVQEMYNFLGKTGISDKYKKLFDDLQNLDTTISKEFFNALLIKREDKGSMLKYIDKKEEYFDALKAIDAISNNNYDVFIRNLSVRLFKDSKRLENIKSYVLDVLAIVGENETPWEEYLLLKGVLKNPNYIYIKGDCVLKINQQEIDLKKLNSVMSICSEAVKDTIFMSIPQKIVTTIENLTSFHDYKGNELIIYLGGFSNHSKVEILKRLNSDIDNLSFRHFGDMDFGGFSILSHLRRETGIEITPLHMDIKMLQARKELTKEPSVTYLNKLKTLLNDEYLQDCQKTIQYLIDNQVILEQETY